jgi:SAM-dependent methyltransferase
MAFDTLALTYDLTFTETKTGRWLRGRVHARLNRMYKAGMHVLELGCGTGEDARHLAAQGVRITATDASPKMLEIAAAKNISTPLAQFVPLDLANLPEDEFLEPLDGAFASFGVLNCLGDWKPLAEWLGKRVRPGGKIAFGIMSPYCAWEIMWHGAHGDLRSATRRLRRSTRFKPTHTVDIPIYYPPPRRIARDFASYFERTHIEGLALVLPPSEIYPVIEKRPKLHTRLTNLDNRLSRVKLLAPFADHYWIEFERVESEKGEVKS